MAVLEFGKVLLWHAAGLAGLVLVLVLVAVVRKDHRLVRGARAGFYALFVLLAGASACLVHGFLEGTYNNEYIFGYSERDLGTFFKIAGLWAGLDGSLLFWTLILSGVCAGVALQHRWSSNHPQGRRMEPYVYLVLTGVLGFFVALCIHQDPFQSMDFETRRGLALANSIAMDSQGNILDGKGLNPQLNNYWFVIHPPCLYLGMVIFTAPFAFAMGALLSGELGDYWVRTVRRWALGAWLFLTCGIILGGLWAYRQLGWGGYWAWDPVENASFLPWCAATAFLHSIMIQERRDMLKWWNAFLVVLTFFLTIEATYMTRSGEVASVHSFAGGGDIGLWLRVFKWTIAGTGLFLIFFRFWDLRGGHRLESILSREAFFFFNNLVLVTIAVAMWFLSWLPTNSHAYLGERKEFEPHDFNLVMTPLLILLLTLTAFGPGLAWVKTSWAGLRKYFFRPVLVALLTVGACYAYWISSGRVTSAKEVFLPKPIEDWLKDSGSTSGDTHYSVGLYPTGIVIFLAVLILTTVAAEFIRGMRARVRFRKEDHVTALTNLVTRDNRRYGGYVVHVGIAVLTLGIITSAMFRIEVGEEFGKALHIGESMQLGPYSVTPVRASLTNGDLLMAEADLREGRRTLAEIEPGLPYLRDSVVFRVTRGESSALPQAHGEGSRDADSSPAAPGDIVCELEPERRFYPKQQNWINEVSIHRRLLEDVYIYYRGRDASGRLIVTGFVNPLMMAIWAGWGIMILGGLLALMPFGGNRVGLSE